MKAVPQASRPRAAGGAPTLALALALALALLQGCASTPLPAAGSAALAPAPGASGAAAAAGDSPPVQVEIEAPAALRVLLQRHLDIARLAQLPRADAVTGDELGRLLDATPLQVRELLQTEGHFAPRVTLSRQPVPGAGIEKVHVRVDPGPLTRVSRLHIDFQGELERAASAGDARALSVLRSLREQWSLAVGGEFRNSDWSDAKTALLTRLRAAGYPAASWSGTQATVDPAASEARLFLVADSGPLFLAGELQIEGLQRQDADTVRHLANFAPGVPVTEALLLDFQERLQKAGLFESVSVAVDPDPAQAARAAIQVQLREQALQVWTVGLGISANNGPRTSVEHVHRRFLGAAINASNKIEWGQKRQTWSGELSTHAQAGLRRHLLGGVIERQESDTDLVVSQRLRLGRAHDGQRLERLYFVEAERGERREAGQRTTTFALSGNGHMVLRRLDSAVLPTDGYTLSLQLGAGRSHGNRSASGPFGRAYSRLTVYRPLGRSWYGQARVELGQVFLGGAVAAPDSQLWRAGGDDSVRGYAYRSLGPVVGGGVASGSVLATASVELARPLFEDMPSLWGAVFVDAGRAATSFGGLNPALGLGAGVRWRSPVGPLRLDIARGQETGQWRLHFSVAIAF